MIMCADHPGLTFNLSLVRTEPTYNQPLQQWTFVSDFAVSDVSFFPSRSRWVVLSFSHQALNHHNFSQVRDYSGTYTVKLLPCTSPQSLEFTIPPVCNPREPLTFDMDIRFQQVTSPCLELKRTTWESLLFSSTTTLHLKKSQKTVSINLCWAWGQ